MGGVEADIFSLEPEPKKKYLKPEPRKNGSAPQHRTREEDGLHSGLFTEEVGVIIFNIRLNS